MTESKQTSHARLLTFPISQSPAGGRLDALREVSRGMRTDLLMDYHEFQPSTPSTLYKDGGKVFERVKGVYVPRRIRFTGAFMVKGGELPACLDDLPTDDPTRLLTGALAWRAPDKQNYYLFGVRVDEHPSLMIVAQRCEAEERSSASLETNLTRDWSPPPPSPARLVPNPVRLRQRYGGDPITFLLDGRLHHRRLFIGGVDIQDEQRPDVHAVLNLGEDASRWTATTPPHPADRWDNKGEGRKGMSATDIAEAACWVIERLQAGRRVLVHCSAGMNRSSTVCCAVLILLENMTAEAALERVREHHPWARPDSHHWLALRWLAHTL